MVGSRATEGFAHRLRVRLGSPTGPRGVLYHCESRTGRQFWKVRLESGEWVWPDQQGGLLVDGPGDVERICESCGLRFVLRAGSGELICTRCDREQFPGATYEGIEEDPLPLKRFAESRRWRPRARPSKTDW